MSSKRGTGSSFPTVGYLFNIKRYYLQYVALGMLLGCAAPAPAAPRLAYRQLEAGPERTALTLTVYEGGRARVQDVRRAELPGGEALLRFPDVSNLLDGSSVQLRALAGGPLEVLEQAFDPGTLAPGKAIAAFLGKQVEVRLPAEGSQPAKLVKATLVAADGPMVEIDGKLYLKPPGELVLPATPKGLEPTATLSWKLRRGGTRTYEAAYMTGGLTWQARYELALDAAATKGQLAAWAALTNDTAVAFPDAKVVAVAGHLGGVGGGIPLFARAEKAYDATGAAPAAPTPTTQVDEFHRYDLGGGLTLPAGQTHQWPLLPTQDVAVARHYRFESWGGSDANPRPTQIRLELAPLAVPLAAGRYQVYGPDGALVGQANAPDLAAGERPKLDTGSATDVVGEQRQASVQVLADKLREERYAVTLRNHKPMAVAVDVIEHPGGDWTLTEASVAGKRVDANELAFRLDVPASGEVTLTYALRIKSPS
jgi:hypothetical protein